MVGRESPIWFSGSWPYPIFPEYIIVPVYPKIRLKFLDASKWLKRLDSVQDLADLVISSLSNGTTVEPGEWDLHLEFSNNLKEGIRRDRRYSTDHKRTLLLGSHPRFVWRGVLSRSGKPLLEVLIDATGMERSFPIYGIVWHDSLLAGLWSLLLERFPEQLQERLTPQLYEFVRKSTEALVHLRGPL